MKRVLKASAGTGKTYRLSLEYLASIMRGINFQNIVVMTFTRKATAELRQRILSHMKNIINGGRESEIYNNLLAVYDDIKFNKLYLSNVYKKMLKDKDNINIFTIDSFINHIFTKSIAPYIGIYSYDIIEDDKNIEFVEEVFRKLINDQESFNKVEEFLTKNAERNIDKYIDLIQKLIKNRWKFLLITQEKRKKENFKQPYIIMDRCLNILECIARKKNKELNDNFYIKDFKNIINEYCKLDTIAEKKEIIYKNNSLFFKNSFWNGNKIRGKSVKDLKDDLKRNYKDLKTQLARKIYNEDMIPYEEDLFSISTTVFNLYDKIKFKEKKFSHSDISNYTYKYLYDKNLNLLEDNNFSDYFYEIIGTKVNTLLIDEFQDTSILQWKILSPIIERSSNIITVGDEKQSIYGWRGGEKKLFTNLDKILSGKVDSLQTCYRSEGEIIKFINCFFDNLDKDWYYEKVNTPGSKTNGYIEVLLGGENACLNTDTKTFNKKSSERQQEIINLNAKITKNLQKEIAKKIKNNFTNYNDITILARTGRELTEIADELKKVDIPFILESRDSIIEHEAVKPLYYLLAYLNYGDYFNLLNFLRSDLIFINNKLLKYMLKNRTEIKNFLDEENIRLKYNDLEEILKNIKNIRKLDYSNQCKKVIEYSGVINKYADNSSALKNIYYFYEKMKIHESLNNFMNYIEDNKKTEELKQHGIREADAVKLMTIHKAKGLSFKNEFFYWNPGHRSNNRKNELNIFIKFDEKYGQVDDYLITNSAYHKLFTYLDISYAEELEEKNLVEEINNIYVALSRPIKNLFLYIEAPCQLKVNKEGYCWSNNQKYGIYENSILKATNSYNLIELVEGKKIGNLNTENTKDEYTKNTVKLNNFGEYFTIDKVSENRINEIVSNKNFINTIKKEYDRLKGLAIHYFLQFIIYDSKEERNYAKKMVYIKYGNILGPQYCNEVFKRVERFLDNNKYYFRNYWNILTEYELLHNNEMIRIDRLMFNEEKNKILILDYKSGHNAEKKQLVKYKNAVAAKTKNKYKITAKFVEV